MTIKHNKKRNTGFVYEALIRELTRAAVEGKPKRRIKLAKTIKEAFSGKTMLGKELDCYRALNETNSLDAAQAEKLVTTVKEVYRSLDHKKLFLEQSHLINLINKEFGSYVFSNYVPNYKDLATISNMFNVSVPIKSKILIEQNIIDKLRQESENKSTSEKEVNNLVLREFTRNFNKEYAHLLPEQRQFLTYYITSESDNGTEFKVFLNEELYRIKEAVRKSLDTEEVKEDEEMVETTNKVLSLIEEYKNRDLSENDLKKFMKMQKLVSEYHSNAD
jgi:hypothetical protein